MFSVTGCDMAWLTDLIVGALQTQHQISQSAVQGLGPLSLPHCACHVVAATRVEMVGGDFLARNESDSRTCLGGVDMMHVLTRCLVCSEGWCVFKSALG